MNLARREAIAAAFDPSGVGLENGNLFGLPFDADTAGILVLGVPWEVTVSYHQGTAQGPRRVLAASPQLDLYDLDNPDGWRQGIYMPPIPEWIEQRNGELRPQAAQVIAATERGIDMSADPALAAVNAGSAAVNQWVYEQTRQALAAGQRVGVIGGDHSVPLGALQALGEHMGDFGVLHIDAHADLRRAYQGFTYSHASIMYNLLAVPQMRRLVQVGIRDICQAEVEVIANSQGRIVAHYDSQLKRQLYGGTPWLAQCRAIMEPLPEQVYVSFDVDGLDPKLCPHTGTPVPGGLELEQAFCLLRQAIDSGRRIVGFDLCEVGDGEWDGSVGARIVYKLCCLMGLR